MRTHLECLVGVCRDVVREALREQYSNDRMAAVMRLVSIRRVDSMLGHIEGELQAECWNDTAGAYEDTKDAESAA